MDGKTMRKTQAATGWP